MTEVFEEEHHCFGNFGVLEEAAGVECADQVDESFQEVVENRVVVDFKCVESNAVERDQVVENFAAPAEALVFCSVDVGVGRERSCREEGYVRHQNIG